MDIQNKESSAQIEIFNRETGSLEVEKVYGESAVKFLYQNDWGRRLNKVLTRPQISMAYGLLQSAPFSRFKVPKFINNFNINMSEYIGGSLAGKSKEESYSNFNEFFIRAFSPGKRNFQERDQDLSAPCEARYLGWQVNSDVITVPIKGKHLAPSQFVQREKWWKTFENGPLFIARLCPVDYHRYHFPDKAEVLDSYPVHGPLDSVNPMALSYRPNILVENERHVTILQTENFGKMAYIEVGALCVGKIIQSYSGSKVQRGQEKGYFLFGGSTVVVLGEPNGFQIDKDILERSLYGQETYIKLGTKIGSQK